ncbi:hypothetical protein [Microvirga terricola]|uniref:Uncharacterized protein n=1 Tax=Microvirga terricola TaxID=2719797 RepID=A0ABX0VBW0_9HYPH|nr:hypothetical protein [Microvirga terricola]NIX76871.1 hypothetical protein [Microvirga terricola]
MFSILRFIAIVGAIFYYSPVRQTGDGAAAFDSLLGWTKSAQDAKAAAPTPETAARLEDMWQALPESAKQAVIGKILTASGATAEAKPTDTLQATDRHPAWRGDANKPRS